MSKNTKEGSRFATAALVLGIIGVVLSFIPIINNVAFVLGILALIFSIITLVKKKQIATGVIALVFALASMGITLAMQKSFSESLNEVGEEINTSLDNISGKNTEDILNNDVEVTFGEFTVTENEYGIQSPMLVTTVKNKTSSVQSFTLKIEAVHTNGNRVADDTLYANNLGPNQSQEFKVFTLVSSDNYESLKTATFKVISAAK